MAAINGTGVKWMRKELRNHIEKYDIVDDAVEGEQRVKYRKTKYLPVPTSDANLRDPDIAKRYNDYLLRAVFYPVTRRTLDGLVGQIFYRDPSHNLDKAGDLERVSLDISGTGLSIGQQAKRVTQNTLKHGRAGLLADYPRTEGPVTRADKEGGLHAIAREYESRDIINWNVQLVGNRQKLTLLVLREIFEDRKNEFEVETYVGYRVCRLEGGVYTQQLYIDRTGGQPLPQERVVPTKADGTSFDEIPFTFVGADNNDADIDQPPLYPIAALNMAHYRNSADYEESAFFVGQPTLKVSGLSEKWLKDVFGGEIKVGARGALPLPENADADFIQAEPNTIAKEAMDTKEKQMVALGAKLVEQKTVQRTAKEAGQDRVSEMSVLSTIAENVSAAYIEVLKWLALFEERSPSYLDDIEFELNKDFEIDKMGADERRSLIEEWQADAISFPEFRRELRKDGRALDDDEQAISDMKKYASLLPTKSTRTPTPTIPTTRPG
jgi:hypothetical protein